MAEPTSRPEAQEKKPLDWEALVAEKAEAYGLPVEDLKREVRRELTAHLAREIVEKILKPPFDYKAAGMTSPVTW